MRITHALRCTNLIAKSAAGVAFWGVNLFASQASLDAYRASSTVLAADKARATLLSTAVLQSLGITNAVATTNPPGAVTLRDGTLGYGAHNLHPRSDDISNDSWVKRGACTVTADQGIGPSGSVTMDLLSSLGGDSSSDVYYLGLTVASGVRIEPSIYITKVTGTGTLKIQSANAPANGLWSVDLSLVPAGLQRITRSHAAVTVTTEFTGTGNVYSGLQFYMASGSISILVGGVQVNYGPVSTDYILTTTAAVYAPRISFDRGAGSNHMVSSADLDQWVIRGTATAIPGTARSNGVAMSLVSVGALGTNDIYKITSALGLATSARCDIAFWIEKVSTTGTLQVVNAQNSANGAWSIDLSKVPTGPQWISRGHPAVTITTEFSSANGLGTGAGYLLAASAGTLSFYVAASLQAQAIHTSAYLRTFAAAPLYTAGTPRSQNLATGSGTQLINCVAGCVYTIIHQGTGSYTITGGIATTTTSGVATVATSVFNNFTLTVTGTPTLLQVYEGTATLAYVAGPYSEYPQAGLLREVGRTNSIRNSTMVGAAAGSAGTLPTGWTGGGVGTLTQTLATGTENGQPYLDIRLNGTTSTTLAYYGLEAVANTTASNGQAWTANALARLAAGSMTNVTGVGMHIDEYTSVPAFVAGGDQQYKLTPIYQPITYIRTLSGGATTARIQPLLVVSFASGVAIDITIRVLCPQNELGAFPTSYIPTTTASVTRDADLIRPPTTWINDTAQTTLVEYVPSKSPPADPMTVLARGNGLVSYMSTNYIGISDSTNSGIISNTVASGSPTRVATRYSSGGIGASLNGSAVATGAFDGSMGTSASAVGWGDDGSGGNGFSGLLTRISIATRAANDADLQAASAGGR